jgi:hypothetical protein
VTDRLVARLLGRFGVKPRTIRVGDGTPKGYLRADLADAFSRYLTCSAATSATASESLTNSLDREPPQTCAVALADPGQTACDFADVADVALDDGCCLARATLGEP